MKNRQGNTWDIVIGNNRGWFSFHLQDIWRYKDLLQMLVKRDVVTLYKQTILGPIWFLLQPIFTTVAYMFIFGNIAGISTEGMPQVLFYLSGIVIWNFFNECFSQTSDTFSSNQELFGKVYFPRLVVPLSKVISAFIKFSIQLLLFLVFWLYYWQKGVLEIKLTILIFPISLLLMSFIGLGLGLVFSSLTTKYRDLKFLIQFGVQLLMFASPIIYPLSSIKPENQFYFLLNPLTSIIESFRFSFLNKGYFEYSTLLWSAGFCVFILFLGLLIFNKTEKDFIDTV